MNDAADGKRKPRSIMATDSEWTRIRERAERERISISRYVVRQSLERSKDQLGRAGFR